MTVSQNRPYISPQEYLEGEQISSIKHEYIQGQVYAMAGASDAHVLISINLVTLLRSHVRGTGCRTYMADMKAAIEQANIYYYPDVMVTCDERDRTSEYFKRYPGLIVEVLSPKTEAFDRGGKFADYRQLATLQEYVLISQEQVRVECFRRNSEGLWVLYPYEEKDEIHLASVNFSCSISALYEDVILTGKLLSGDS